MAQRRVATVFVRVTRHTVVTQACLHTRHAQVIRLEELQSGPAALNESALDSSVALSLCRSV